MDKEIKRHKKPYSKNTFQWKVFPVPKSDLIFFQAYNQSRSMRACPDVLAPFLENKGPVARASYQGKGSRRGFVFSYLLRCSMSALHQLAKENGRKLSIQRMHMPLDEKTDSQFNICSEHVNLGGLASFFVQMLRIDIADFCQHKPVLHPREINHYSLVDRIEPKPEFTRIKATPKLIVKDGKGTFSDACQLDIGIDLSKGCISNTSDSGIYDPSKKCAYCYAFQNGPCFLDTVYDIDEDSMVGWINGKIREKGIEDKEKIYFRLGQTVDSDVPPAMRRIPGFKDNYRITLNALVRIAEERRLHNQDIQVAMPTKIVEFDDELADLLKQVNGSILASIGYEPLEKGIIGHGYTVEKRLEGILAFGMAGVNANLCVATDITRSMDEMQPDARIAWEFFNRHKEYLGLQFLDIRITKHSLAPVIGGQPWDELICSAQRNLFTDYQGAWKKGQYLHAWATHPDFLKIIGDNRGRVRLCSTHARPEERRCGMCFMDRKY
jgi:hypothetical protein